MTHVPMTGVADVAGPDFFPPTIRNTAVREDSSFFRIFGDHQGRSTSGSRIEIRDAAFIADLQARLSGLAAHDNRARGNGWLIDFTPAQTDVLTERSIFRARLTSESLGTREMAFQVGRDWVEVGDGAMESSVRGDTRNIDLALESAFRRVVLLWPQGTVDPAKVKRARRLSASAPPVAGTALRYRCQVA